MKQSEQIKFTDKDSWKAIDISKVKQAYEIDSIEEIIALWEDNYIVRIADTLDFEYAYEDYIKSNSEIDYITYEEFLEEINKGYGNSGRIEIARLLVLSNGIYYDNEYC